MPCVGHFVSIADIHSRFYRCMNKNLFFHVTQVNFSRCLVTLSSFVELVLSFILLNVVLIALLEVFGENDVSETVVAH